ncbi:hypothetical protein C2S53_009448 [Perilla frutescens var. hirtella]|uniref:Peptidase A1 domain-containing protein n=1 Tax=Perilla frutescens var. hirtella TaxID=608512 RepID=A0AAD4JCF0_PERFH|nr:hypothetical protein C2S53_009448 [Perilla frutescens var. hirtella]
MVESFNNGGITVDLIHRDSPRSPSYDPSNTRFQRLRSAFDRAFSRKASLMSSSLSPAGGEYLMKIMIGSPPVEQLGIADTGSDLTWIQCKPCTQCYKQNLPLFDPSRTSSYRPVSCESDQCTSSGTASCDRHNSCQYQDSYGDNSYSSGELAVDTFTFDGGVSFPKVAFGCGHSNDGTFSQTGSGIVGLGGGSISIINQLQSSIGGKFSYCLALLNSNVSSKISFGSSAVVGGPNAVSTPLVKKKEATFYYLTLEGVSVGAERVDYYVSSNKASGMGGGDDGNIIIDSGTTLTFLPEELYDGVEAALVEAVTTGSRVSDPSGVFKLCYRSEGGVSSPSITAHFRGADVVLPQGSIFVEVEKGIVCLTLVPSQDFAIFGNLHQINYHIGYDLLNHRLSFMPTDCSKPLQ